MNSRPQLYSVHERIWHWLQVTVIVLLILTGFSIHYSGRFDILGSLANVVRYHSWIGLVLLVNAFLGIFYHITAEKYHHFLPKMEDFSEAAALQARYYLYGIFKGEKHPLEIGPHRKLNPLQKITYLALLNVLLPLQILTGILLWGADRWPELFDKVGGLWVLAPAHTLCAYLFLAFLIGHIYLSTTGETPRSLFCAMIVGEPKANSSDTEG